VPVLQHPLPWHSRCRRGASTPSLTTGPLRLQFDRSVKLEFCGTSISSDGGPLRDRELDDALGLADLTAGRNGRHRLAGLPRQSIFSRPAGYEDVNDADRLHRDLVMRRLVGGQALKRSEASASAMGLFETAMLTRPENLAALPGRWIDAAHDRRPPKVGVPARELINAFVGRRSRFARSSWPAKLGSQRASSRITWQSAFGHGSLIEGRPSGECRIKLPSIPAIGSHHQTFGSNT
jgi:hypothetical protein